MVQRLARLLGTFKIGKLRTSSCPECKGTGLLYQRVKGPMPSGSSSGMLVTKCERCHGTGRNGVIDTRG